MKVLILNGPNINFIGKREPEIYGSVDYYGLCSMLKEEASKIDIELEIFQSNIEGELINKLQSVYQKVDFIIANLGAYTHTSIALRDALLAVNIPFIEIHISNVFKREKFRHKSLFSDIAIGVIAGIGIYGYIAALHAAKNYRATR